MLNCVLSRLYTADNDAVQHLKNLESESAYERNEKYTLSYTILININIVINLKIIFIPLGSIDL